MGIGLRTQVVSAGRGKGFQAVILAGGLGTRLWPITTALPKSMVPVAGRPFMEYQLAYLRRKGVREVVVCLGHLGHLIEQHFGDGRRFGVQIHYGYERERLLGTAGAVKNAESLLRDVFVLIYGDSYAVCDIPRAMKYFLSQGRLGLMVVYRNDNLWDRSNVALDGPYVAAYEKGKELPGLAYIDFGVSIFRREAFAAVPAGIPSDLSAVYQALIAQRQLLKYETRERFYETGSPEGLREFESLVWAGAIREFPGPLWWPQARARV